MMAWDLYIRLSDLEKQQRKDLQNALRQKVKLEIPLYMAQRDLRKLQTRYKKVRDCILKCKSLITTKPIQRDVIYIWEIASPFTAETDFSLTAKAYAYLLYYKKQIKLLSSSILKLKHKVKNLQREKDLGFATAIKNLENFDILMKAKYEKINSF